MAYADPQSVTISGTANTLPRVGTGPSSSVYRKDDGTVELTVSHLVGKRFRRQAKVTTTKIASDPLVPTQNMRLSASAYVVLDVPPAGFTVAEQTALIASLAAWLTASSGANALKLVGGES